MWAALLRKPSAATISATATAPGVVTVANGYMPPKPAAATITIALHRIDTSYINILFLSAEDC